MSHTLQINALDRLGEGLRKAGADEDALRVFEAQLAEVRRDGASNDILIALGRSHPTARGIRWQLRHARAALAARESPPPGGA